MKTVNKWIAVAAAVAGCWSVDTSARAAIVATYSFTGANTTTETGAQYDASNVAEGISASAISDPANSIGLEISSAATTPANAPFLRIDPTANNTTPSTALSGNKYFQFSIIAGSFTDADLSSLTFNAARGGAGTPRGFFVRSSADNYASTLTATGTGLVNNADATVAGYDIGTVRPTYTAVNVDLSAAAFQNIQSLPSRTLTFRVYNYAPAAGSSVDYDDITVNGTATIPEPASAGLSLLTMVGLLSARRRKR